MQHSSMMPACWDTESILPELLVSPLGRSLAVFSLSHFKPLSRYIWGAWGGGNWSISNSRVLFAFCWKFGRAGNWSWLSKTMPALRQQATLIYHKDPSGLVCALLRPIPIHTLLHPQFLHMFWTPALPEIPLTPCHGAWFPIFPKAQQDNKKVLWATKGHCYLEVMPPSATEYKVCVWITFLIW